MATTESVTIAAIKNPFRTERVLIELPAGGSVADMLRVLGLEETISARLFVDDRVIKLDERDKIFPKPGQTLTIRVVPVGGGRGKDVELLTIAVAAIATIATYGAGSFLAAPTAAAAAGTTGAGSGFSIGGIGFAGLANITARGLAIAAFEGALNESIKFLGGLAVNALIPPPRTPVAKQETTPHSYTVSGTANAAAPFSPIPKLYGQRRIFPQYAASPYNELVGFNQYLRMLFLLGYGPLDISQIKIGDTAIEDYEDVEWELRSGLADASADRCCLGVYICFFLFFLQNPDLTRRKFISARLFAFDRKLVNSSAPKTLRKRRMRAFPSGITFSAYSEPTRILLLYLRLRYPVTAAESL